MPRLLSQNINQLKKKKNKMHDRAYGAVHVEVVYCFAPTFSDNRYVLLVVVVKDVGFLYSLFDGDGVDENDSWVPLLGPVNVLRRTQV